MPTATAQSLLSLPDDATDPNPYAVLGLRQGEHDAATIAEALKATVTRLNALKPSADPDQWQQAALWVKRSRKVLLDPQLKAQLDARPPATPQSGRPTVPSHRPTATASDARSQSAAVAATAAVDDPLAGLLPGTAPAAAAAGPAAPRFRAGPAHLPPPQLSAGSGAVPAPPADDADPLAGESEDSLPSAEPMAAVVPVIPVGNQQTPSYRRRRRRFPWAALVMTAMTLVCVGGIAWLVYFLNQNPGGIVINLQPSPGAPAAGGAGPVAAPPVEPAPQEPPDPIMGRLGTETTGARTRRRDGARERGAADDWPTTLPESVEGADEAMEPAEPTVITPAPSTAEPATPDASDEPAPMQPSDAPMTAEPDDDDPRVQTALAAIDQARQAIGTANWNTMERLAEAATGAAATAEQKAQASRLAQLAELAVYYRGAIDRGLGTLSAGESFNVTEQLQVVVVEIGSEKVTLRYNGRNREFPRAELPLVLAHRIARFALSPDAPTSIAASNAYQAVAPVSTQQYRQQAINALQSMDDEVEGADPAEVAQAIRDVFGL